MVCEKLGARDDRSVVSCRAIFIGMVVDGFECSKKKNRYEVNSECWLQ